MPDWEDLCDASYEEQPHHDIVPREVRTLSRKRALAILDAAVLAGLTTKSRLDPRVTRRARWETCYFHMCESTSSLIPWALAEMIITEFRDEAESVAKQDKET